MTRTTTEADGDEATIKNHGRAEESDCIQVEVDIPATGYSWSYVIEEYDDAKGGSFVVAPKELPEAVVDEICAVVVREYGVELVDPGALDTVHPDDRPEWADDENDDVGRGDGAMTDGGQVVESEDEPTDVQETRAYWYQNDAETVIVTREWEPRGGIVVRTDTEKMWNYTDNTYDVVQEFTRTYEIDDHGRLIGDGDYWSAEGKLWWDYADERHLTLLEARFPHDDIPDDMSQHRAV